MNNEEISETADIYINGLKNAKTIEKEISYSLVQIASMLTVIALRMPEPVAEVDK